MRIKHKLFPNKLLLLKFGVTLITTSILLFILFKKTDKSYNHNTNTNSNFYKYPAKRRKNSSRSIVKTTDQIQTLFTIY
jgi:hypothetical protein